MANSNINSDKITAQDWTDKDITPLPDRPGSIGMTSQELKERFDAAAKLVIAPKLNQLIDDLKAATGAANIGTSDGKTVQAALNTLKNNGIGRMYYDGQHGQLNIESADGKTTKTVDIGFTDDDKNVISKTGNHFFVDSINFHSDTGVFDFGFQSGKGESTNAQVEISEYVENTVDNKLNYVKTGVTHRFLYDNDRYLGERIETENGSVVTKFGDIAKYVLDGVTKIYADDVNAIYSDVTITSKLDNLIYYPYQFDEYQPGLAVRFATPAINGVVHYLNINGTPGFPTGPMNGPFTMEFTEEKIGDNANIYTYVGSQLKKDGVVFDNFSELYDQAVTCNALIFYQNKLYYFVDKNPFFDSTSTANQIAFATIVSQYNFITEKIDVSLSIISITGTFDLTSKIDTIREFKINLSDGMSAAQVTQLNKATSDITELEGSLEGFEAALARKANKSEVENLAAVAKSGSYNDLSDKPAIPSLLNYRTSEEQDVIDAKKTEKVRIDIDVQNKTFKMGDTSLNFKQLNDLLQNSPNFCVFVMGKREHRCTFIDMDSNPRQMRFVAPLLNDGYLKTQSVYVTSNDGINITTMTSSDINCENVSNKVSEITDANKTSTAKYPSIKAVADYVTATLNNLNGNGVAY